MSTLFATTFSKRGGARSLITTYRQQAPALVGKESKRAPRASALAVCAMVMFPVVLVVAGVAMAIGQADRRRDVMREYYRQQDERMARAVDLVGEALTTCRAKEIAAATPLLDCVSQHLHRSR